MKEDKLTIFEVTMVTKDKKKRSFFDIIQIEVVPTSGLVILYEVDDNVLVFPKLIQILL